MLHVRTRARKQMNCHTAAQAEAGEGERRHAQCLVLLAEGALPLFSRKKIILVAALPCLAGEVGFSVVAIPCACSVLVLVCAVRGRQEHKAGWLHITLFACVFVCTARVCAHVLVWRPLLYFVARRCTTSTARTATGTASGSVSFGRRLVFFFLVWVEAVL